VSRLTTDYTDHTDSGQVTRTPCPGRAVFRGATLLNYRHAGHAPLAHSTLGVL
jgi:hypothetical protein